MAKIDNKLAILSGQSGTTKKLIGKGWAEAREQADILLPISTKKVF